MTVGNTTMAGIGTTTAPNQDTRFADIQGDNVQRHGQVITLDYDELFWSGNQFSYQSRECNSLSVNIL